MDPFKVEVKSEWTSYSVLPHIEIVHSEEVQWMLNWLIFFDWY